MKRKGPKMGKTIELELSRHDTINLIHALAIAYRSARREDKQAELGELYDRIQAELMKGEDDAEVR